MEIPVDTRILKSMTTTVGLVVEDGVVLGADKRATAGFMIASRKVKKIVRLTDYAAMTLSGLVADAQVLAEAVREEAKLYEMSTGRRLSVKGLATLLSNILFSSKWFPFLVQLMVGGYDEKPRLYVLDLFGSITEERYAATGSGSPLALGVLEERYDDKLSIEEASKIAALAIRSAVLRDAASGDGADILVITGKGFEERFIPFKDLVGY